MMVAFSPSALRLLDHAVTQFTDAARQKRWSLWEQAHPEIRRPPGAAWDDWGDSPLPGDIVETALFALDQLAMRLRDQRGSARISEDEASDLDNELSHIRSIREFLRQAPSSPLRRTG